MSPGQALWCCATAPHARPAPATGSNAPPAPGDSLPHHGDSPVVTQTPVCCDVIMCDYNRTPGYKIK